MGGRSAGGRPVIVRATVPAEEFALHHVLSDHPDATFEVERIVETGDDALMPLLWVRDVDRASLEAAFEDDESVDDVSLLAGFEQEFLYRMVWVGRVELILHMLTNSRATIMDAYGTGTRWQLRALYPDRERFSSTHDYCHDHGLEFQVDSIRELDGDPAGRYGLTDAQFTALVEATRRGHYEVPREISLEELADELGVSHQALSERLRRATGALVEDTLLIGPGVEED